jgi:ADP-heptose:LPS heptosyltransferase
MAVDPKWEKGVTDPVCVTPDYLSSHLFVQIANLLRTIGCDVSCADDLRVEINLSDDDRLVAERLTASLMGRPYGVIFPGATGFRHIKMWPADRFADVVRILGRNGLRSWLICGARKERDDCTRLAALIRASHANVETAILCGQPLKHVAAVLEGASLVVGNDNGGMHLAVAMGRPTVSIVTGALRKHFFPWGDQKRQRAVMHQLDCWGCRYDCILPRVMCIEGISSELVAAECQCILDDQDARRD